MNRILLIIFLGLTLASSRAQNSRDIMEMEMKAQDYFQGFQFHLAKGYYLQLVEITPDNPAYLYPLGVCLIQERSDHALPYLQKCAETPELYPDALSFYLGKAYHLNDEFEKAKTYYIGYKALLESATKKNDIKKNQPLIAKLEREIAACNFGLEISLNPLDIEIQNLSNTVNSEFPDYGPILSADEKTLIFTSERNSTTGGHVDELDGRFDEDIYVSYQTEDGSWTVPKNMGDNVNTEGQDAAISISPDGHFLLIYRYDKEGNGDIYFSEKKGTLWTKAQPFPEPINSKSWEPSACLSADDRTLIFASNREGGFGGTDLYSIKKLPDGTWGDPINLGPDVNTSQNEDSPFLHADGKTLYFSSDGHNTMGGFDIFITRLHNKTHQWTTPENIGYPINTAHDDIYCTWSADGKRIYFSSIGHDTHGHEDIYVAEMDHMEESPILLKSGHIMDPKMDKPVKAKIRVKDKDSSIIIGEYFSNGATGAYTLILSEGGNYEIKVIADGYKEITYNIDNTNTQNFQRIQKDILLEPGG